MSSLININQRLHDLIHICETCEEEGKEVPQEIQDELANVLTNQAEKVDGYASFLSQKESHIEFLEKEIALMEAEKDRQRKQIDKLKSYAKYAMEKSGVSKLEGLRGHSFALRSSTSVMVHDESKIPQRYMDAITTYKPDKAKLRNDLNNGVLIDGVTLHKKTNIVIK